MMLLSPQEKEQLKAHTDLLMKTYNEIKNHFDNLPPAKAAAVCEEYGWFEKMRPTLVEQIKGFSVAKDKVFKIDKEAADLFDRAVQMNKRTLDLIDTVTARARQLLV